MYPGATCDESEFDPDYPFDHLLWMSVNAEVANMWWQENFIWRADKIINRVKTMDGYLDCDAPIAKNREDHVITAFHQTLAARKSWLGGCRPALMQQSRHAYPCA